MNAWRINLNGKHYSTHYSTSRTNAAKALADWKAQVHYIPAGELTATRYNGGRLDNFGN